MCFVFTWTFSTPPLPPTQNTQITTLFSGTDSRVTFFLWNSTSIQQGFSLHISTIQTIQIISVKIIQDFYFCEFIFFSALFRFIDLLPVNHWCLCCYQRRMVKLLCKLSKYLLYHCLTTSIMLLNVYLMPHTLVRLTQSTVF